MKKIRKLTANNGGHPTAQPMYLDLKEFQALSGLPYRSLELMIESKQLPHVVIGKKRLIHHAELLRLESLISSSGSATTSSSKGV
jgi:hypothetical protein